MLNKIALVNFIALILCTIFVAEQSPEVAAFLTLGIDKIPLKLGLVEFEILPGALAISIILAISFRVVNLHDRISDMIGLRKRFDVGRIMRPLAEGVGLVVDERLKRDFDRRRDTN